MNDVVRLDTVSNVYGRGRNTVFALREVSIGTPRGGFAAVTGPSGPGKSTFLRYAAALVCVCGLLAVAGPRGAAEPAGHAVPLVLAAGDRKVPEAGDGDKAGSEAGRAPTAGGAAADANAGLSAGSQGSVRITAVPRGSVRITTAPHVHRVAGVTAEAPGRRV
ncbi:hypothetical protein [Streptosporangium carneum]|uniref:ABC transporter domain-containing protein n=1 Tax=Streptosporangium carneum TaxID=47481 RepID=A0A9W6I3Z8_9ACTN|nr:hypothetical protein [Streptosporangium carneum]GLK10549.1 hypothetical protein GCM10017600_39550 [Streptosporangium carneum]